MAAVPAELALVGIRDFAGRPRGTGFAADAEGTVVTSHEAVDGLTRVLVHSLGGRTHLAERDAVTPLPEWDLALIRTEGLGLAPALVGAERAAGIATPVRLFTWEDERADGRGCEGRACDAEGGCAVRGACADEGACAGEGGCWAGEGCRLAEAGARSCRRAEDGAACTQRAVEPPRGVPWDAELSGRARTVTYTSTDRLQELEGALELALPQAAASRLHPNRHASGSPVVDPRTGAVLAVLGTALHAPRSGRSPAFAVPLRTAAMWDPQGPLGTLLARNAATVPGFGPDLNLAGALRLTGATVRPALRRAAAVAATYVDRLEVTAALRQFSTSGASVTALVGRAGTGRTTLLAQLAAQRAGGPEPALTVWLRGAQLREGDGSVRDSVGRALASGVPGHGPAPGAGPADAAAGGQAAAACRADVVARLAREARRPLLVLLDAPEEMPARLAGELRRWCAGTASWLRAAGARMVLACGREQWQAIGELLPPELLFDAGGEAEAGRGAGGSLAGRMPGTPQDGPPLPPCVRVGDLEGTDARLAREAHGLGDADLAPADAGHPLVLRMLREIRAGQGHHHTAEPETGGAAAQVLSRDRVFAAYLSLAALRVACRVCGPAAAAGAVRRTAARASGALHEAARRCLGPARGALGRDDFERVFPRAGGWAQAVLAEGVLEAAGGRFRFADEEFGDWLQGRHLDVDAALAALVPGRTGGAAAGTPSEPATAAPADPGTDAVEAARVPRHRLGPVAHSLVLTVELEGPEALQRRLRPLAEAVTSDVGAHERDGEAAWWARRLLRETLLRVPDARPYYGLLRGLAEHIAAGGPAAGEGFGPSFWRRLALPTAQRTGLLRLLLPADVPRAAAAGTGRERYLDAVRELLVSEPETVQPLLCGWFTDRRPLRRPPSGPEAPPGAAIRAADGRAGAARAARAAGDAEGDRGLPRPTVASAAQALLYAHRGQALDMTLDLLTDACHPRADELLAELAEEESAALCRAVERWAHDERTLRRIAAAEYGPRMARQARTAECRRRLEDAARALLRPAGDPASYGPAALTMLLRLGQSASTRPPARPAPAGPPSRPGSARDPEQPKAVQPPEAHLLAQPGGPSEVGQGTGQRELLETALHHLAATGSAELSDALADELTLRPTAGLAAFRAWLCGRPGSGAHHLAGALAAACGPGLVVPTAEVVREYAETHPQRAGDALAAFVRVRLSHRPEGCAGLQLLTDALLCTPHAPLRAHLARALGGAPGPGPRKLLDVLLVGERDAAVLEAALRTVAHGSQHGEGRERRELAVPLGARTRAAAPSGEWPPRGEAPPEEEAAPPAGPDRAAPAEARVPCGHR